MKLRGRKTPLTDALSLEKREVYFTHTSPGWEGVRDSRYEYFPKENVELNEVLDLTRRLEQDRAAAVEALQKIVGYDLTDEAAIVALCKGVLAEIGGTTNG